MGALYKGVIATGVLSLVALYAPSQNIDRPRHARSRRRRDLHRHDLFCCGWSGLAVTAPDRVITEYYTGTNYRPVRVDRASLRDRPRHQRNPGPGGFDGSRPPCRRW